MAALPQKAPPKEAPVTDELDSRLAAQPADPLRIPAAMKDVVEPMMRWIDKFCALYLDGEYARLSTKMLATLARKRPSPLLRVDLLNWAAAIVYTVGRVNFLTDPSQTRP